MSKKRTAYSDTFKAEAVAKLKENSENVTQTAQHGFAGSMTRKGNCHDNAPIERFWGQMKNELIYHKIYETR